MTKTSSPGSSSGTSSRCPAQMKRPCRPRRAARCSISPSHRPVPDPDRVHVGPVQGGDRVHEGLGGLLVVDPAYRAHDLAADRYPEPSAARRPGPPRCAWAPGQSMAGLMTRTRSGAAMPRRTASAATAPPTARKTSVRRPEVALDADVGAAAGPGLELVEREAVERVHDARRSGSFRRPAGRARRPSRCGCGRRRSPPAPGARSADAGTGDLAGRDRGDQLGHADHAQAGLGGAGEQAGRRCRPRQRCRRSRQR